MAFSDEVTERKYRPDTRPVTLINPMAEDESVLRTSLVPSMLRTIQWNMNRGIRDLQLYEIGKTYAAGGEGRSLILAAVGALRTKSVHEAEREFNFYDLKGDVEAILDSFDIDLDAKIGPLRPYYHPGRALQAGADLVVFGELHPDYADQYKLRHRVYLAEFTVDGLLESGARRTIQAVPKFPSIRRDFSLLLNRGTRYAEVERAVTALNIPELVQVEPFDRLDSGPFPQSKFALAISLMYRSPERTLTDEEVEGFDKRILETLRQRLGAELRQS
jgi:phenylalanyl-tRNA synthetase beta chain